RQDLGAEHLAPDAALHLCERQRRAILPRHDLAIDSGAVGQERAERVELREAIGDQLLAARPEKRAPLTADELGADAVPFPFHLPIADIAEVLDRALQRIGEEEWIRAADVGIFGLGL